VNETLAGNIRSVMSLEAHTHKLKGKKLFPANFRSEWKSFLRNLLHAKEKEEKLHSLHGMPK